ncbi:MAG TPA: ribonuclease D [Thermoanaerobaculia bacterium]|jgi:ribonuclease D|nr:ribonuclease D [Thermoanaerobaculia bacterium]
MTSALEHPPPRHLLFEGDIPLSLYGELSRAPRIAWDIETSGLDWSTDRIALCQLHVENSPVTIVRISSQAPARLRSLLENATIRKVFHHAMFDVRFMAHHWNARPQNIVCTKIASKLLFPGQPDEQKLQSLVARFLGISLDKSEQRSNWFAGTYSSAQLAYAAGDVLHLPDLLDKLMTQLEERSLRSLADRCFEHIPTRVDLEINRFGDVYEY